MTTLAVPPHPPTTGIALTESQFLGLRANLLPEELIIARQGHRARKIALLSMVVAVAVMAAYTLFATWQISSAKSDLHGAQQHAKLLTQQQNDYAALVEAKAQSSVIEGQLNILMTNDLNWSKLYDTINKAVPTGATLDSVTGSITAATPGVAAPAISTSNNQVLNNTDSPVIGTLTILGTAANKTTLAAYVDKLSKLSGIVAPYPASIAEATGKLSFQVTCLITAKSLGGRFSTTGGTK